jgi:hypothetical protein
MENYLVPALLEIKDYRYYKANWVRITKSETSTKKMQMSRKEILITLPALNGLFSRTLC